MDKLKEIMPKIFVDLAALLVLGLAVSLLTMIPALAGHGIMMGVVAGAFGYDRLRDQIRKLPGL
jgi:hypothetical protein